MESRYTASGDVRLHYLVAGERGLPMLMAPGLSDKAEDYAGVLEALEPHRAVAMSFRGQGRSGVPSTGFDLEDYASDIGAVIDDLGAPRVVIFAHSRAVAYVIAFARAHEDRVSALLLGDSGAIHRAFPTEWVDDFAASTWRGQLVGERMPREVLVGIQREARQVDLWEDLAALSVPRFAVLGGAHPPDVLSDLSARFKEADTEVVVFEASDHALWEPALDRFVRLLREVATESGLSNS